MAEKRRDFPRFFFLSNDELIDILANSQDIERIQLHLKTLFDNLVRMEVEGDSIKAIISGEKERVRLKQDVKAVGNVEAWLRKLQDGMIASLSAYMKAGAMAYPAADRKEFVKAHPGQIVATVCQIMWSEGVAAAIEGMAGDALALKDFAETSNK